MSKGIKGKPLAAAAPGGRRRVAQKPGLAKKGKPAALDAKNAKGPFVRLMADGGVWSASDKAFCLAVVRKVWPDLSSEALHNAEISIVLGDDALLQNLNRRYRRRNGPTNVLSFPMDDEPDANGGFLAGDIVLSYETIKKEAVEQKTTFHHHLAHMLVHGILHLLGYDHEKDGEALVMETVEYKVLEELKYVEMV